MMVQRSRAPGERARAEDGVTLVEMLVYTALLTGVMVVVGTVLVQTMWVQHHIVGLNEASTATQTQLESIELAVRNSSELRVLDSGNLLLVKRRSTVEGSAGAAVCSGWYFNASTGALHAASNSADPTSPTPRTVAASASPNAAASWPVLIDGARRLGGDPVFTYDSARKLVRINIEVTTTRDRKPVHFETQVSQRNPGATLGGVSCF